MIKYLKPHSKIKIFFSSWEIPFRNMAIIALLTLIAQICIVSMVPNNWNVFHHVIHVYGWAAWLLFLILHHTVKFLKLIKNGEEN